MSTAASVRNHQKVINLDATYTGVNGFLLVRLLSM